LLHEAAEAFLTVPQQLVCCFALANVGRHSDDCRDVAFLVKDRRIDYQGGKRRAIPMPDDELPGPTFSRGQLIHNGASLVAR
jgi:hypothetical protein